MPVRASACVLVVGDRPNVPDALAHAARSAGYRVQAAPDVAAACALLRTEDVPVVLARMAAPDSGALTLLRAAGRPWPAARVIFCFDDLHGHGGPAWPAVRGGAFDCLDGPLDEDHVRDRVTAAWRAYHQQLASRPERFGPKRVKPTSGPARPRPRTLAALSPRGIPALVGRPKDPGQLYASLAQSALDATSALDAWAVTWDGDEQRVFSAHRPGAGDEPDAPLGFASEVRLAARALTRPTASAGRGAYIGAPVIGVAGITGAIVVAVEPAYDYTPVASLLQPLADQAAVARRMLGLQRQIDGWCDMLLDTLVTALTVHDRHSGEHSHRVADLTTRLAARLGYEDPSTEIAELRRGALMHDIGKLGVDAAILQKPGPLTEGEWAQIHRHPEYGYLILKDIPSLNGAAEMIYASHERWDGDGYPRGLRGEEIPVGARVFALADAWDAMTSDRPYRRALRPDDALREVQVNSGTQFDPEVVHAFEALAGRWSAERQTRESAA